MAAITQIHRDWEAWAFACLPIHHKAIQKESICTGQATQGRTMGSQSKIWKQTIPKLSIDTRIGLDLVYQGERGEVMAPFLGKLQMVNCI